MNGLEDNYEALISAIFNDIATEKILQKYGLLENKEVFEEETEEWQRLRKLGMSFPKIAKKYETNGSTVYRRLKRLKGAV